jgi:Right handed beta helix region
MLTGVCMNHKKYFLPFTVFLLLTAYSLPLTATIRYVSHTGSSAPPYTTWETAADSIQKCIDYSVDGDTIIVANGVYYESLIINKYLWLWGSSMDSTVVDGTNLANFTIEYQSDGYLQNFLVKGKGEGTTSTECIIVNSSNVFMENCRILNAAYGIGVIFSSSIVNQCIITNVKQGYGTYGTDTSSSIIKNSIIVTNAVQDATGVHIEGGSNTAINNIILTNPDYLYTQEGVGVYFDAKTNIIQNNIISGFRYGIDGISSDTAIVHNNISVNAKVRGFLINALTGMRNNIAAYDGVGVDYPTVSSSDYNLYWQNDINTVELGENDIVADPMFVNDTIPASDMNFDYHIQMFSPAIDSGDPNILDIDGTRSDIGAYGGPGGESYTYLNLPPRPPVNLNAMVEDSTITLNWNKNSEADTSYYKVYRDTSANFTIDSTNLIGSTTDTIFVELVPKQILKLYYKVTCVDTKGNESEPSEEAVIILTVGIDEWKVINNYTLYQNYPNPFNPSTKIGYKLIERGLVKIMVYDITGSLVSVLVNEEQEAGYYEVEFGSQRSEVRGQLSSGIYLYRIEVIGEGNIPRFSDMKKMILIK